MSNLIVVNFPASSTTGVAPLQTLAAAGNLTLNSPLANTGAGDAYISFPNIQRTVSLTSANNLSAVNFTITGEDVTGLAVTETRAGPNNNTVETNAHFNIITSISASGAAAAVSAGTGTDGFSQWILLDGMRKDFQASLQCVVTGAVTYDVWKTLDRLETYGVNTKTGGTVTLDSPTEFAVDASLTAATTNEFFYLNNPVTALRADIQTGSTGSLVFTILQQGPL